MQVRVKANPSHPATPPRQSPRGIEREAVAAAIAVAEPRYAPKHRGPPSTSGEGTGAKGAVHPLWLHPTRPRDSGLYRCPNAQPPPPAPPQRNRPHLPRANDHTLDRSVPLHMQPSHPHTRGAQTTARGRRLQPRARDRGDGNLPTPHRGWEGPLPRLPPWIRRSGSHSTSPATATSRLAKRPTGAGAGASGNGRNVYGKAAARLRVQ